ncbi:hypothetical protein Ddye_018432 [Dipteronia dyeriana]|uniref:S-locus glycoprotein domain-containing protein n=1 Tax=Dipteronia dyeriana TaxID=168575 RepID=A0AAD9X1R8_9ROSI|nr:hypothetical protein Ddye_018432 [Dipteronia dyeriana]
MIIDDSGQIKQMFWLDARKAWFQFWSTPRQPCQVYAYCGAFGSCGEQTQPFCGCVSGFKPNSEQNWNLLQDYSGGCVRKTQLKCEKNSLANGKSDRFLADGFYNLENTEGLFYLKMTKTTRIYYCSSLGPKSTGKMGQWSDSGKRTADKF